jgi:calcium-dependent protein kinase
VHRDLKLENVVYESNEPNSEIKIIDFGLSKKLTNKVNKKRHTRVGSAFYMGNKFNKYKNNQKKTIKKKKINKDHFSPFF